MIENKQNEIQMSNKEVELSGSDRLSRKKRRMGSLVLSAAAITAVCVSIAAAAGAPREEDTAADLSEYRYESAENASVSELGQTADKGSARAAVTVPEVKLPNAVPEGYSSQSVSVDVIPAYDSSPMAYDVTINADGERYDVVANGTVEDALERTGIELGSSDMVTPSLETALSDNIVITVQRVQYVKVKTSADIPSDTEYVEDSTLPIGETAVVTEGSEGKLERTYLVKRVDGEDVKSKLLSEDVTVLPVNTVIANGTYEDDFDLYDDGEYDLNDDYSDNYGIETASAGYYEDMPVYSGEGTPASQVSAVSQFAVPENLILDENNVPLKYTQALHGKSCAYTAEEGALMSTGKAVEQGYVAVNPQIIPYGTKMYIVADDGEVYGYAIAADTGGSVGRNDILVDLFMWSYDECIQWGAKNVTIYILDEETE